jgi:uncharacterized protein YjbJ (UPF0337 family)
MNWEQLEGRWKEFAGSACAHWSKLTDDDWQAITGRKEQLATRVQQRYGITREAAERQIDEWSNALLDVVEPVRARLFVERSAKQRRSMAAAVETSTSKGTIK